MEENAEYLDKPRPEVEGPNPFPTGSRIETSTEIYAAGAPPIEAKSPIVMKVKELRAARLNIESARPAPMGHERSQRVQEGLALIMPKIERLKSPTTPEQWPHYDD